MKKLLLILSTVLLLSSCEVPDTISTSTPPIEITKLASTGTYDTVLVVKSEAKQYFYTPSHKYIGSIDLKSTPPANLFFLLIVGIVIGCFLMLSNK